MAGIRLLAVPPPPADQLAFDDIDLPLSATTFVIVDLETTGTSPVNDAITEIGAVKVRGGEVLGELATLVDPGRSVPPQVTQLTGITTAMVYAAPPIAQVLPSFLEFAAGSVLVAHNARFDMGFLRAAALQCDTAWPKTQVLCTVQLARRILTREEAPSVRLHSLARLFRTAATPTHRALDDARATADVLHELLARVGNQGVHTVPDLLAYLPGVTSAQRTKRTLAQCLPELPGVYLFRGPGGEPLYTGTSVNLRRRVRGYFTGSETRSRMKEMVSLATAIDHVVCAHALEAGVRELRLIAAHAPPYNRRSKFPKRAWWLALSSEAFPRFSITRQARPAALGPFRNRGDAVDVAATIAEFCGIRTCTRRIPAHAAHDCEPELVGGCPAAQPVPVTTARYAAAAESATSLILGTANAPARAMVDRISVHAASGHYETASRLRDRAATAITALRRTQRLAALARLPEITAARPDGNGGWDFAVVRFGQLASAATARRGVAPMVAAEQAIVSAQTVIPDTGHPLHGAPAEETALILNWLALPGTRIVRCDAGYAEPAGGVGPLESWLEKARAAAQCADG